MKEVFVVVLEKLSIGNNKGCCAERGFDDCAGKLSICDNRGALCFVRLMVDCWRYRRY